MDKRNDKVKFILNKLYYGPLRKKAKQEANKKNIKNSKVLIRIKNNTKKINNNGMKNWFNHIDKEIRIQTNNAESKIKVNSETQVKELDNKMDDLINSIAKKSSSKVKNSFNLSNLSGILETIYDNNKQEKRGIKRTMNHSPRNNNTIKKLRIMKPQEKAAFTRKLYKLRQQIEEINALKKNSRTRSGKLYK